jgi:tRNA(fMet)-specific endonuclease VapC
MTFLLDTSVYSQPLRNKPVESSLLRWRDAGDRDCRVSLVSVAEVEWALHLESREARWQRYSRILEGRLPVLETDSEVWRQFARMKARQQQLGQIVSDLDLLIGAAAVIHQLVVATLNAGDFSRIEGLAWEDWSR